MSHRFLLALLACLIAFCSGNKSTKASGTALRIDAGQSVDPAALPEIKDLYGEASALLDRGLEMAQNQEWDQAHQSLEKALEIISRIEIRDQTDPRIAAAVDTLRRKTLNAAEYVLPHVRHLAGEVSMEAVEEKLEEDMARVGDTLPDTTVTEIFADTGIFDIPLVYNRRVESCIRFFQTTGRAPFQLWMQRMGHHRPLISRKLREAGMPQNLIYLAMIESGFNCRAYSRSHAAGLWQFIPSTGKNYGLHQDWWIDERYDPEKATDAAIAYLKDLYELFGDWHLAMAAYNAGENGIRRALRKSRYSDFWNLPRRSIKPETQNYVPKIIAATLICKNPAQYGFDSMPPFGAVEFDTVLVEHCIALDTLAWCANTNLDTLRFLNPSLRRFCTPPHMSPFVMRVPASTAAQFRTRYAELGDSAFISWTRLEAQQEQLISEIAANSGTTPEFLMALNALPGPRIQAGARLLIPARGRAQETEIVEQLSRIVEARRGRYSEPPPGRKKVYYRIRPGDVLGKIAERFGVTVAQIREWNGLRYHSQIIAGKSLVLFVRDRRSAATSPGPGPGQIVVPGGSYTVRPGETLWSIARRMGVPVRALAELNGLDNASRIRAGMVLRVPGNTPQPQDKPGQRKILYEVRTGDTVTSIAQNFNLRPADVLRWNNLNTSSLIKPGNLITLWLPAGQAAN